MYRLLRSNFYPLRNSGLVIFFGARVMTVWRRLGWSGDFSEPVHDLSREAVSGVKSSTKNGRST
jgi:hypothetical protein